MNVLLIIKPEIPLPRNLDQVIYDTDGSYQNAACHNAESGNPKPPLAHRETKKSKGDPDGRDAKSGRAYSQAA